MNWLRRHTTVIVSVLAISVVLTAVIVNPTGVGTKAEPGSVSKATHRAPRTVTYKSDIKTSAAEHAASEAISPVYRYDPTAPSQQNAKFTAAVGALNAVRASAAADKAAQFQQLLPGLTSEQAVNLVSLPDPAWQEVQTTAQTELSALQVGHITTDDLTRADELANAQIPNGTSRDLRAAVSALTARLLIPNFVIDQEQTAAARKKASDAVTPVSYTVEKDQVVAYKGQLLTDFDVERLQAVGLTRPSFNVQRTFGVGLLVLLFTALLLYITPRYAKGEPYPVRIYSLLAGFALLITVAGVVAAPTQPILAYVFPVAAPALLLTIFYGFDFAIIAGVCLAALYALANGGSFELFFIHLAAAIGAVIFAGRIRTIFGFVRVGVLVAVLVFVGMTGFKLLAGTFVVLGPGGHSDVPKFLLAAALNGALTTTFVFAGVAFLGNLLGRVTFLQLLELENPRQPLLRRLAAAAPGTYSHSLRMAAIVEAVAEDIGADPLLARVQTLHHDIGKIALPEYFVENQRGENLHAKLSPKESADILRAHISEGLILAREYGLPEEVAAAIPEHHGTTLMAYFWDAAKKKDPQAKESDFRYFGPSPRSKETAIIMLADAVEAASRTLKKPTEKNIRELIHGLFTARIDDGQLDHAPLSTRDLRRMKEAFAQAVINDLHKRIEYPRG